ncbi:MAG TPA: acyl-CoA desaturase [Pseudolabrys sp.]|nr:acyl-CoA desaturase [Pseudolabrys sp.]
MLSDIEADGTQDDIIYPSALPFLSVHLACFGAIWSGVTWQSVVLCASLYWLRIFAIGAGYHRYFSHHAYSTSRAFQFVLAFLSQTSAQKSVLWWAAKHRQHHLYSDTSRDVHSPRRHGFIYSHLGWIFVRKHSPTDFAKVADFARYPEVRWLHKFEQLPAVALALACLLVGGWSGLVVGFFWSTVFVYHATFSINSLGHVSGGRRYVTGDDSRNNWLLALFTMGEGWHNNHHACQSSVRQGFRWWEIDPTYYLLRVLSGLGIVWKLKTPSATVLRNEQRLGARVVNRAAAQLAAHFNAERLAHAIRSAVCGPELLALQEMLSQAHHRAVEVLVSLHLPQLPTREAFLIEAKAMFARTPSLDDIVDRAYEFLLASVGARLAEQVERRS